MNLLKTFRWNRKKNLPAVLILLIGGVGYLIYDISFLMPFFGILMSWQYAGHKLKKTLKFLIPTVSFQAGFFLLILTASAQSLIQSGSLPSQALELLILPAGLAWVLFMPGIGTGMLLSVYHMAELFNTLRHLLAVNQVNPALSGELFFIHPLIDIGLRAFSVITLIMGLYYTKLHKKLLESPQKNKDSRLDKYILKRKKQGN
ncbi:MAG: hypothetical protein ACOX6S_12890 [Clostridia bacterium]|jgi:hypothetical protein